MYAFVLHSMCVCMYVAMYLQTIKPYCTMDQTDDQNNSMNTLCGSDNFL